MEKKWGKERKWKRKKRSRKKNSNERKKKEHTVAAVMADRGERRRWSRGLKRE